MTILLQSRTPEIGARPHVLLAAPSLISDSPVFRTLGSKYFVRTLDPRDLPRAPDILWADAIVMEIQAVIDPMKVIRVTRQLSKHVPIVGYVDLTPTSAHSLIEFGRAGMDEVIVRNSDDLAARIGEVLERHNFRRTADLINRGVGRRRNELLEKIVSASLRNIAGPFTVSSLASELGIPRRTLCKRIADDGLPPPSQLISWCRLIHAAECLQSTNCSVESIGIGLGFGSAAGLRNMLRRHSGMCCRELRTSAGLTRLLTIFCMLLPDLES
jgi:AraC-like DNA-binding protein